MIDWKGILIGQVPAATVRLVRLILSMAACLFALAAPATAQGTIEGSLQLDSETVPLTHVYARQAAPGAGSGGRGNVIILMTDRPAPPEVQASRRAYDAAAGEGRIRGALLVLEPEPLFVLVAAGGNQVRTPLPDALEHIALSDLRLEDGRVSGRLQMAEPDQLSAGDNGETFTYRINATFDAPIDLGAQPTATLTGEAARSSAEARAAVRLLEVIRTGSVADVQRSVEPRNQSWSQMSAEDAAMAVAMIQAFVPDPATFLQSIQEIRLYGDLASIAAREGDVTTTLSIRRVGDQWMLTQGPVPND